MKVKTALVLYMPVIHKTYLELLDSRRWDNVFLIDNQFAQELFEPLRKDMRAVDAATICSMLVRRDGAPCIRVVSGTNASAIAQDFDKVVLPDEEISHIFAERYLGDVSIEFAFVFLRYDSNRTTVPVRLNPDEEITTDDFAKAMIARCEALSEKSADWWRQIGGLVVKNGQVIEELTCFNHAEPVEMNHHHVGDPRSNFKKGLNTELTIFLHTEQGIVSKAARLGISLESADLFVTTFPCPWCAKAVAEAGFSSVFYRDGYAMLDGEEVLKVNDVKIIHVV